MPYDSAVGDLVFRPGAHLSMNYFLDTTDRVSRWMGREVVDCLVFLAILGENFRDLAGKPSDAFGTTTEAPHPVSITALARVLDMPYETVRRHTLALSAAGFCCKQKGGYVASSQVADRLDLDDLLSDMTTATRTLLENLARVGAPLPRSPRPVDLGRQSGRMAIRYYVDGLAGLCRALKLDVLRAIILLNIVRKNHTAFESAVGLPAEPSDQAAWFTDPMRQSVTTYCIAKTLRLPYETVRRHCQALLNQGVIERDEKGQLLVTGRLLETPRGLDAAKQAWITTRAFLESLARQDLPVPQAAFA